MSLEQAAEVFAILREMTQAERDRVLIDLLSVSLDDGTIEIEDGRLIWTGDATVLGESVCAGARIQ